VLANKKFRLISVIFTIAAFGAVVALSASSGVDPLVCALF
jgi:hypothetical protein